MSTEDEPHVRLWLKALWEESFTPADLGSERSVFLAGAYLVDTLQEVRRGLREPWDVYVGWGRLDGCDFPDRSIVIHRGDEHALPQFLGTDGPVRLKEYGVLRGRSFLRHGLCTAGWAEVLHDAVRDARSAHRSAAAATAWEAIPIGYSTPVVPPPRHADADRPVDLSFAGSIGHRSQWRLRDALLNPKKIARMEMIRALDRIKADGRYQVVVKSTQGFGDKGEGTDAYARLLLDSKVVLAPRGTSRETYRHFEAAMAGCVVVTEPLPDLWYYASAPFVYVRDWSNLRDVVDRLLSDPQSLQALGERTRAWWHDVCAPAALAGRVLASVDAWYAGHATGAGPTATPGSGTAAR